MMKIHCFLLILSTLCFSCWAEEVPTLFFSPAERLAIQQKRLTGEGATQSQRWVRFAGMVQRGSEKNTVWVNDQAYVQGNPIYPEAKAGVLLLQGQRLRVGDQFDTLNGTTQNLLPTDSIQKKTQK